MRHAPRVTTRRYRGALLLLATLAAHTAPAFLLAPASALPWHRARRPAWSIMSRRHAKGGGAVTAAEVTKLPHAQVKDAVQPVPPTKHPDSGANFLWWLITWPLRDLLPEVRLPTFMNMAWAAALCYMYKEKQMTSLALDPMPHNLLSGALGFFLTFRANEGYSRCVEARHVWDNVMNRSRDIVRTAVAYEPVIGTPRARRIVDLTCAFGVVLEEYACQRTRARELEILLRPSDLAALELASNRPLAVIELLSEEIIGYGASSRDARNSMEYQRLLGFLDELGHQVTQVERLLKAPIPAAYYGHALRFLTVWVFTLPLALLDKLPMPALVPATGFVTWALFGLRELGIKAMFPFQIGVVDMQGLWRELVWDARTTFEGARVARELSKNGENDTEAVGKK